MHVVVPSPALASSADADSNAGDLASLPKRARRPVPFQVGPSTIEEVLNWPHTVLDNMGDTVLKKFLRNYSDGIEVYSQFSGMGGPEIGLDIMEQALRAEGFALPPLPSSQSNYKGGFHFMQAGDIKPVAQRVLLNYAGRCKHKHVFHNILHRVPEDLRIQLDELTPSSAMTEEQRSACVDAIHELLAANRHRLFPADAMAFCHTHGRDCLLYQGHDDAAHVVRIMWAGTPCLDVSAMGARTGMTGPQTAPLCVWVEEIRSKCWHIVFHECTPDFDDRAFERALGDLYTVLMTLMTLPT
jgi:hypothetical protein